LVGVASSSRENVGPLCSQGRKWNAESIVISNRMLKIHIMKSFTPHFHEISNGGLLTCCVEHVTHMQKREMYSKLKSEKGMEYISYTAIHV